MLSTEIAKLEQQNQKLKAMLDDMIQKEKEGQIVKPKSCQYCRHFMQHYIRQIQSNGTIYQPIYDGHCTRGVPISKGGKRRPKPDETCLYFEAGPHEAKYL